MQTINDQTTMTSVTGGGYGGLAIRAGAFLIGYGIGGPAGGLAATLLIGFFSGDC